MTGRAGRQVAWWLLVALFVGGTATGLLAGGTGDSDELIVGAFAMYGAVGALVALRRPDNPVGWVFLCVGALTGLFGLTDSLIRVALDGGLPLPWWGTLAAWLESWLWYPLIGLATTLTVLLFPSGLASRRWRPVVWLAVASLAVVMLVGALSPRLQLGSLQQFVPNPVSPSWLPSWASSDSSVLATVAGFVGLAFCGSAAVVSAVLRYRRSRGAERLQMRWFAFSAVVLACVLTVFWNTDRLVGEVAIDLALAFVPLSCGLAILRYRLYDIDRVISRTAAYVLVTGGVLALYALVVTTVPRLLPVSSSFAVAVATLAAAAAARPLLSRARRLVDRRFNREHVDAELTVEAFGARLRDEVDPVTVVDDLLGVAHRTMQPAVAGVWLRGAQ